MKIGPRYGRPSSGGLSDGRDGASLAEAWDWTPLLALNRTFHFKIFQLSPASMILHEVERLWGLADPFIASKLSLLEARRRTIAEHDQLLQAMRRRDRPGAVAALEQHRASTQALLPLPATADKPSTRGSKRRQTA
jgi:DNA-binding GntR family transcriptional regulator